MLFSQKFMQDFAFGVSGLAAGGVLLSTESRTCVVNRTHSTVDDRAFAAASPGLWNSLPPHLRDADLPYSRFRRSLKTFFVWIVGPRRSVNFFNCAV